VATLTVRNLPDDAKHRFRQIAAAHGRSMEEHLRQLVIEAGFGDAGPSASHVSDVPAAFRHKGLGEDVVRELIKAAEGARDDGLDRRKYAEIRFMTAKDAMAELRRLANGVGFDAPRKMNPDLEAPQF
jgi:hypothetical protein